MSFNVSFEKAKTLKKAGFSCFCSEEYVEFEDYRGSKTLLILPKDNSVFGGILCYSPYENKWAAPNSAELLNELRNLNLKWYLTYNKMGVWMLKIDYTHNTYLSNGGVIARNAEIEFKNENLSHACADMWLWCRKEGYL